MPGCGARARHRCCSGTSAVPLRSLFQSAGFTLLWIGLAAGRAGAQAVPAPAAPSGPWTGSVGGGVALTSGNTDTSTVNVTYDVTYDPKTKNVVKSDALYLRGKKDGESIVNRLGFNVRDQYNLGPRAFVFGQFQDPRDTFKAIDYLVAPTAGLGFKVVDTPQTSFTVDGGVGGVWEKNPESDVNTLGGGDCQRAPHAQTLRHRQPRRTAERTLEDVRRRRCAVRLRHRVDRRA